jgi:hypothetical protein
MHVPAAVPLPVRAAGIIVALQGLTAIAFAVAVLIRALRGNAPAGTNLYGEAAYFTILGGLVLVAATGLILGKRWARTPSVVIQLLLLGVAYYATIPSARPEFGLPTAALSLLVLALFLTPRARTWAIGEPPTPPPEDPDRRH